MKINKLISYFLIIIFLTISQISCLPNLPLPFNNLNLVLLTVIFIMVILSYRLGLYFALFLGLGLELFSVFNFGIIIISLLITTIIINYLFNRLFTNRSLYSLLILGLVGILIYQILILLLSYLSFVFNLNLVHINLTVAYWINLLWQLGLSVVILTLTFLITQFLSKKFKQVLK